MEQVTEILQDWRFAGGVLFVGAFLGSLLYRRTPAPRGAAGHVEKMVRAGLASHLANRVGARQLETMADLVGLREGAAARSSLRRQRRWLLVCGLVVAGMVLLPLYMYAPVSSFPDWAFGVLAAVGAFRAWQSW